MDMKAQIFTLDLIIGLILVISIISASYYIFNYYLKYNLQTMSQDNKVLSIYSAFNSFLASNSTVYKFAGFEESTVSASSLNAYIAGTLKAEIGSPFSLLVYTNSTAGSSALPNNLIYTYNSSGFSPNSGNTLATSQLVVIYNPGTSTLVSFDLFTLKVDV
ncbi:MAG: hypothetical protein OH316_00370 [Candidatus Parvarchaeota archaeon]|nr:hypothetical protein [Candidatus Parvarchaeota archaeon]MCW1301581.1 hypothetical protein [Candidatus Parvarchaeota archaeon]